MSKKLLFIRKNRYRRDLLKYAASLHRRSKVSKLEIQPSPQPMDNDDNNYNQQIDEQQFDDQNVIKLTLMASLSSSAKQSQSTTPSQEIIYQNDNTQQQQQQSHHYHPPLPPLPDNKATSVKRVNRIGPIGNSEIGYTHHGNPHNTNKSVFTSKSPISYRHKSTVSTSSLYYKKKTKYIPPHMPLAQPKPLGMSVDEWLHHDN